MTLPLRLTQTLQSVLPSNHLEAILPDAVQPVAATTERRNRFEAKLTKCMVFPMRLRLNAWTFALCFILLPIPGFCQSQVFGSFLSSYADADIGWPGIAGSANYTNGAWTIAGGGADIWSDTDSFNFASEPVSGDQAIVAEVTSVTYTDGWAKSGVMFRDSSAAGSIFIDVVITPGYSVNMQSRDESGNDLNQQISAVPAPTPSAPVWVQLVKSGNGYSGYYSLDGINWTQIGNTVNISLTNSTYLAGIAVTAHNNSLLNTSTFTNVSVTPLSTSANLSSAFVNANSSSSLTALSATLDAGTYITLAQDFSLPDGIAYRYGQPSTFPSDGLPTLYQPPDYRFDNHGYPEWVYQIGGAQDLSKNDYNNNIAQVLYVPDQTQDAGVDAIETLLMAEGTFSEKPQLPWQYYGGGHPDPDIGQPAYISANGGPLQQPTAIGRSYGLYGWDVNDLVAFQSGLIAAFGTNTSRGSVSVKLPPGKVPTAVAVTDNNEFALVTVWDTNTMKGQVAVLALATGNQFWNDWAALYPGLRNNGLFTFIKLLGFVDLPGMTQPTEISASTDYAASFDDDQGWFWAPDSSTIRYFASQLTLTDETNRQSFISGPNQNRYSKAGFATVISKAENKVIFLDLMPLFNEVQTMYFTSPDNLALSQNVGQDPTQWPFTFDVAPGSAPTVAATATMDQPPTAVRTSLLPGVNQAYVATEDGTLHIFSMGGYGTADGGVPSDIAEVGTVAVGSNPTSIAYAKSRFSSPVTPGNQLIVVSRGDRAIRWVKIVGNTGFVFKTLQDTRLHDPVWVEDNDNHGTESPILTVADFAGRQVSNYRYGPITFWTNGGDSFGMGPTGQDRFEFGGAYPVAGFPFQVSGSNIP